MLHFNGFFVCEIDRLYFSYNKVKLQYKDFIKFFQSKCYIMKNPNTAQFMVEPQIHLGNSERITYSFLFKWNRFLLNWSAFLSNWNHQKIFH